MTLTLDQVHSRLAASPRDWDQLCQALVWNVANWTGRAPHAYGSAIEAYKASKIVSKDPAKAGLNDIHFWLIGEFWHVAVGLGNGVALMASGHVTTHWGDPSHHVGTIKVTEYTRVSGARYLGWAHSNGVNKVSIARKSSVPTVAQIKSIQSALGVSQTGKQDTATVKAMQQLLQDMGIYSGKVDGAAGDVTHKAEQKAAKRFGGYDGPEDGDLGVASYAGLVKAVAVMARNRKATAQAAAEKRAAEKAAADKAAAIKHAEQAAADKAAAQKAAYQLKLKQHVNNVPIYLGIEGKPERYAMAGKKVLRHVPPDEYDDAKETGFVSTLLQPGQLDGYQIIDYKH